jgi:hypothetical protein
MYYSLINKVGAKAGLQEDNVIPFIKQDPLLDAFSDDADCEACKL